MLKVSASGLCFAITLAILANLRRLQQRARKGDYEAATKLLLPVYWWLLAGFALTYCMDGAFIYLWGVQRNGAVCSAADLSDCTAQSLAVGFELAFRRGIIDGVAVFLMHKGGGRRSTRRTATLVLPWALFVWFVEFLWQQRPDGGGGGDGDDGGGGGGGDHSHKERDPLSAEFWTPHNTAGDYKTLTVALECAYVGALVVFYGALALTPPHVLYRRPALGRWYVGWQLVTMLLIYADVVSVVIFGLKRNDCLHFASFTIMQVFVGPLALWSTLLNDSKYWQGLFFVEDRQVT